MGNIFSFKGRIKRGPYVVTFLMYVTFYIIFKILILQDRSYGILGFLFIPLVYILWAQGAKRCHDLNKSGWWQLIPFYCFVLMFSEGDYSPNQYDTSYEPFYDADDYEKPYDADSLTVNHVPMHNADSAVE